ncbi:PadR family transcriptional regulator [Melghirimyces algeriensis]|uniref:DNA-binding transcriptional regulator, PadR family n=1 Tax=Melghirimyces algeriensis TaxID=910412 RepID=A0A521FEG3_9BACL|nr:PadR family transcriptional regulator [Melghirimyces algeriensis]SMO94567.1 DNA-binding transcriptional regulator, PadR family [Melghirimyces algeriensis]
MSVKHAILALLYQQNRHGYDIKTQFESMVHGQWPLNAGQVYTTLDRLTRDGLVEPLAEGDRDRKEYRITDAGKEALHQWLLTPVERSLLKDAFFFKLLCAQEIDFPRKSEILNRQRSSLIRHMMQLRQLRAGLDPKRHKAMIYLVEGGILHLEADMKWLEMLLEESEME